MKTVSLGTISLNADGSNCKSDGKYLCRRKYYMKKIGRQGVGVSKPIYYILLFFQFFQIFKIPVSCSINIKFVFDRCYCSWTVVAPVKHVCDSKNKECDRYFCKLKIFTIARGTNERDLVISCPEPMLIYSILLSFWPVETFSMTFQYNFPKLFFFSIECILKVLPIKQLSFINDFLFKIQIHWEF